MMVPYTIFDVFSITDAVDSLFTGYRRSFEGKNSYPRVNLSTSGDEIRIRALVPGIDPESINIEIADTVLSIEGVRKKQDIQGKYVRQEREAGNFKKAVTLSYRVNSDTVHAELRDGILTIRLSKHDDLKPRKIQVQ